MMAESVAEAGTVTIHAVIITMKCDRLTSFLLCISFFAISNCTADSLLLGCFLINLFRLLLFEMKYSLKKPTPNTAPIAMCVELTGKPRADAMMTVIAVAKAIEKARIGFIRVICWPTVLINFGPNRSKPKLMPKAPINITHVGIKTDVLILSYWTACKIAATGPIAFATSFAP